MVRFTYLCHIIGEVSVFLSFLYIKIFELGLELTVAFYNRSAARIHARFQESDRLHRRHIDQGVCFCFSLALFCVCTLGQLFFFLQIKCPGTKEIGKPLQYFYRKGFFALNVQATFFFGAAYMFDLICVCN